jgi:nucleoside-diphosphate-sugar epimerase
MLPANNSALHVFLTGASTPVGREVTRLLVSRGHRVTGLTQGSEGAAQVRQDGGLPVYSDMFRAGEVKSMLAVAKADVVVHAAALAMNSFPTAGLTWDDRVLTDATAALLEAAQAKEVKFFVYPSFAFLYADSHMPVDESGKLRKGAFFRAALKAEELVNASPVPHAILRFGTVYGPHDTGLRALGDGLMRSRPMVLEKGALNWVYVSDAAAAIVATVEKQPAGAVLNVADNQPASSSDFVTYLANAMGTQPPAAPNPLLRSRLNTPAVAAILGTDVRVSSERAKAELGWSPRYADYRAGVENALLAWRAEEPVG